MSEQRILDERSGLDRLRTGIAGIDAITDGGLPIRRTCLVTGSPGTGKTTFGNQLAFAHATRGNQVIVATLLTESHDVLLNNLKSFHFFDPDLVGERVHYMSVMSPLLEGGLDATIAALRREIRKTGATLLIVDGTAVTDDLALSDFDMRRFAQRLEGQLSILGCTTIILANTDDDKSHPLWAQVNGVILLRNQLAGSRQVRMLEIVKMRGIKHAGGLHEFQISEDGIKVYPRLESMAGNRREQRTARHGMGTGIAELDAMLGGGLMPLSTTLLMGTPGAGKTILGLHYIVEGAQQGEPGLIVGFHETEDDLCKTAQGIGLDLRRHIDSGLVQVLWNAPLELSADAWAWSLLSSLKEHQPRRLFVDALTDVNRLMLWPDRMTRFVTALANESRSLGATSLIATEIDEYTSERLGVPIPAASASMDNGIILRHVEVDGQIRRLISVPKVRQSVSDPAIREVKITDGGMNITGPFKSSSALLTGRAAPHAEGSEDDRP